ncbi:cysteine--tRNA ligase [Thermosynechococcaceae cyanobacterium Okahandja]
MPLRLYNTLSRSLEPFTSQEAGRVSIYACGVTVYDYCHLGHARSYVAWDVLRRYLTFLGYTVHYVQNFTDIDDKILRRAQENGESMATVSDRYIAAYHADMAQLNILPATDYPRATAVIPAIIDLIQALIDRGCAYVANGDVYYAVEQFPNYGKLSGRHLSQLVAGASGRVEEADQRKRHPLDFALWKAAKPEEAKVYEPWPSPWGAGRPGWHIECSAMVQQAFGTTVDIHCGGMDLIFPHHENEIAQSEAASQRPLARFWLHNGFVTVNAEKMSKSLGNFTTIRNLLQQGVEPMALRLLVLQAQYRKPLDFTETALEAAAKGWQTLAEALQLHQTLPLDPTGAIAVKDHPSTAAFCGAMDDDLNTAAALAVLFDLAKSLNREQHRYLHGGELGRSLRDLSGDWHTLTRLAQVLGLEVKTTDTSERGLSEQEIEALIQERNAARKAKNYAESDRLRDVLLAQGIKLVDQKDGSTHWFRVPIPSA